LYPPTGSPWAANAVVAKASAHASGKPLINRWLVLIGVSPCKLGPAVRREKTLPDPVSEYILSRRCREEPIDAVDTVRDNLDLEMSRLIGKEERKFDDKILRRYALVCFWVRLSTTDLKTFSQSQHLMTS
jgi:hypothetical protein